MQILAKGVVTDKAGTLCHPIEQPQFGWVAYIYQWVNNDWMKVDTTYAWMPDEEGSYNACAVTYSGGTYALFGYYDPKKDTTKVSKECDFEFNGLYSDYGDISTEESDAFALLFFVPEEMFSLGDPATYSISNVSPSGALLSNLSGSTELMNYWMGLSALFYEPIEYTTEYGDTVSFDVHLYFPTQKCYKDIHFDEIELDYSEGGGECGEGGC
jgi:hypothetical protein